MIHLSFILCRAIDLGLLLVFYMYTSNFTLLLAEEIVFSPGCIFTLIYLSNIKSYNHVLSFGSSIVFSCFICLIWVQVPGCLYYYSSIICLKICNCNPFSNFFVVVQVCFGYLGSFTVPYVLQGFLCFCEECCGILIGIALNLYLLLVGWLFSEN